jgi:four helix bundle protein
LAFAATAMTWLNGWDKKHAVVDQLSRATESVLLNLAEAARQRGASGRLQIVDYSIGSVLECAACLDIARIKRLLLPGNVHASKQQLSEIAKMLIGLRKAWEQSIAREDSVPYEVQPATPPNKPLFHHETLDVYQAGLAFFEWFSSQPQANDLSNRLFRQMDEAGTSMVLNIAEGNGRYAHLDHHRFLQIAQSAAVRVAVYLDLGVQRLLLERASTEKAKELLRRVSAMLAGF